MAKYIPHTFVFAANIRIVPTNNGRLCEPVATAANKKNNSMVIP